MNEQYIFDFLHTKIGNDIGACALMGNLYVESKLQFVYLEGSYARKFGMTSEEYTEIFDAITPSEIDTFSRDGAGYGLAQWTFWSRKTGLWETAKKHDKSVGDRDVQLEYLWNEIQGYKTVVQELKNATDIRETSDVVALRYLKPAHTEEKYLQNRANYGQQFYEKFKMEGGNEMHDYKEVDVAIEELKKTGATKATVVMTAAGLMIGWPYVWGATGGKLCTVANRRAAMASSRIEQGDKDLIVKRCRILNGSKVNCNGCKYYPNEIGTRISDCQGFIKLIFSYVGIKFSGGGCTSMWNNNSNWAEKGTISSMPKDKVCCVFRDVDGVKEHILLYDGMGNYIHDSGEVKRQAIGSYKATHWAIPKGLYDEVKPTPAPDDPTVLPTLRKGDKGSYVSLLQTLLLNRGYRLPKYGADGSFGNETLTAVKQFQNDWDLTVDGIVGKKTWSLLQTTPEKQKMYTVTIPHLSKEMAEDLLKKYSGEMILEM